MPLALALRVGFAGLVMGLRMSFSRRRFLKTAPLGVSTWLAGCDTNPKVSPPASEPTRLERVDGALGRAARFLQDRQSNDGAWHSDVYGPFKEGPCLTPLVVRTLLSLPPELDAESGCRKGSAYLASQVQGDTIGDVAYPVYTAAGAVEALSHPSNAAHRAARDAWLNDLRQRQLTEELGWMPADKPYGGWGYFPGLPRKPKAGEPLRANTESNLSATLFSLEALKSAGVKSDDPAFSKALTFVPALPELQRRSDAA